MGYQQDPDDDAPRLLYADWCESQGDVDRAAFIRVQLERARLPEWDVGQVRLRVHEQRLLRDNNDAWRASLPQLNGVAWGDFRRGFVGHADVDSYEVLLDQQEVLGRVAGLTSLGLPWPDRAAQPQGVRLPQLRGLTIARAVRDPDQVAWLTEAPFLASLQHLALKDGYSPIHGTEHLLSSPHLHGLRSLALIRNETGRQAIPVLVEEGRFPHLTALTLEERGDDATSWSYWDGGIAEEGLDLLMRWPGLAQIERLNLSGNRLDETHVGSLIASPHLTSLHTLELAYILYSSGAIPWESANKGLRLQTLVLSPTSFADVDGTPVSLAEAPCMRDLRCLNLEQTAFEQSDALAIIVEGLPSLEVLHLDRVDHNGDLALEQLSGSTLHSLHAQELYKLTDGGIAQFLRSKGAQSLHLLDLSRNPLGSESAKALDEVALPNLEHLVLPKIAPLQKAMRECNLGRHLEDSGGLDWKEPKRPRSWQ